ncbi:hypothetical protein O3631_05265 [Streptococcus salivarius]|jgi:hypothetical protein|uniref:hypothetical protein n=1 Tax=Streptococcus salivarius TaxID=1304 RepID=UPI00189C2EB1|nr:hypothetical protein [Streptococcus salivarius]
MITQTLVQMAYDRGLRTRDLIKTDKGIAMLKAIVEEEGALGVGYMDAIMDKIDSYFIINATRNIATMGVVSPDTPDVMVQTLIVDEVVSMMNVEEFKDIAPYFLF